MTLDELLQAPPHVHKGRTRTWGIDARLARFIDAQLKPGHVTLETGCGLSTLVVLRRGVSRHIAVAPDADQFDAVREFCALRGIAHAPLVAAVEPSQTYLPAAALPELDLVLVDGDHAFPAPFIDWYYTADRLKVGGLMIVDDTQILTGRVLADFMRVDPRWKAVMEIPGRFSVFRKTRHPIHDGMWREQPYLTDPYPVRRVRVDGFGPLARLGQAVVGLGAAIALRVLPRRAVEALRRRLGRSA